MSQGNRIAGLLLGASVFAWNSRAEVEPESFDLSSYSLLDQVARAFEAKKFFYDESKKPLKLPRFENPYEGLSEEQVKEKVNVLPFMNAMGIASSEILPVAAKVKIELDGWIEIFIPTNRCETGWIKWGDEESGYFKCRALGRGDSVLGPLALLAGLKEKVASYKIWQLSQNAGGFNNKNTKPNSRFEGVSDLSYCLSRPETETNGMTISQRPNSSVGTYQIQTGKTIHPGKEEWGQQPGNNNKRLLPLKMIKIDDPRNSAYAHEGKLLARNDFWVHSHQNERDEWPLEAVSTWGCPRLPRNCMAALQKWAGDRLNDNFPIWLKVTEQDSRALNFDYE